MIRKIGAGGKYKRLIDFPGFFRPSSD